MTARGLRVADYMDHILEAIARIGRYTAGLDFETFAASEMTQDAVIRNLEVIGEACRNIERADPDFASRHPDVPLRPAREMRNVLSHGYFGVDLAVVWRTVARDLPALEARIRAASAGPGGT
jgi:uncharacterized protein with HEPN domain